MLLPVPSFHWLCIQKGCSLTVVLPSLNELCQLGFGRFPSRSRAFSSTVIVGHRQTRQLLRGVDGQTCKMAHHRFAKAAEPGACCGQGQGCGDEGCGGTWKERRPLPARPLMPHGAPKSDHLLPFPFCGRSRPTSCTPCSSLSETPNEASSNF